MRALPALPRRDPTAVTLTANIQHYNQTPFMTRIQVRIQYLTHNWGNFWVGIFGNELYRSHICERQYLFPYGRQCGSVDMVDIVDIVDIW